MRLHETILSSGGPLPSSSSTASGPGAITLHDIQTGTLLASFKQTSSRAHSLAVLETKAAEGGFVLALQADKPLLHAYNFQKDQIASKIVLPEKLTCIAVDPRGFWCAAGTAQGRVYIWEIGSGIMYNAWDAHYRQVTVLRFTHDGAALLSGSEDSGVSVWSVARLVDDDAKDVIPLPERSLSDHTLPVTDISCGVGPYPKCRAITASVDHSVKIWDLSSGTLLTTFSFPKPISCLAWDSTERTFFAASGDNTIYQVNLYRQREDHRVEAVGGLGANDVIRIGEPDAKAKRERYIAVEDPVTAMTISLTTSFLLVGTSTGKIHVYDVPSHQRLRTISPSLSSAAASTVPLPITHIQTMLRPADLIGHVSLDIDPKASQGAEIVPRVVAPFQRTKDAKARERHEVSMILPPSMNEWCSSEELLRDQAFFLQPQSQDKSLTGAVGASDSARVTELEEEVRRLKGDLGKAKALNDEMWDKVVKKVVKQAKEQTGEDKKGESAEERKRKRTRS
ncbi:WD40 repeat-like protein [Punctularia strigosozonata HHB-11173 SS5]|uniref:WD40 repeat-like protein n=1 Tax=Punctularia strigosozonata (strain HHB-11173) TaxID=741275 RepID=UPI0004417C18|nr:WD40 repeat-like protein [Punctularia strigosozonata HHB-11173 SS5]EIN06106.1 WD40 repeat-like protein [Punctularia strigosozonata HHB-11173 SS5]